MVKQTYETQGVEKTRWLQVGTLKEIDGGRQFIELNMFPQTSFYVFEQKPRGGDEGRQPFYGERGNEAQPDSLGEIEL